MEQMKDRTMEVHIQLAMYGPLEGRHERAEGIAKGRLADMYLSMTGLLNPFYVSCFPADFKSRASENDPESVILLVDGMLTDREFDTMKNVVNEIHRVDSRIDMASTTEVMPDSRCMMFEYAIDTKCEKYDPCSIGIDSCNSNILLLLNAKLAEAFGEDNGFKVDYSCLSNDGILDVTVEMYNVERFSNLKRNIHTLTTPGCIHNLMIPFSVNVVGGKL